MADYAESECVTLSQNLEYYINEGNIEEAMNCVKSLSEYLASVEIEVEGVVVPDVPQPTVNIPVNTGPKKPNFVHPFVSQNNAYGLSTVVINPATINQGGVVPNIGNFPQPNPQGVHFNPSIIPQFRPAVPNAAPNQTIAGNIRIIPPVNAVRNIAPAYMQHTTVHINPLQYNGAVPFNNQTIPSGNNIGVPFNNPPAGVPFINRPAGVPFNNPPAGVPFNNPPAGVPFNNPPAGVPFNNQIPQRTMNIGVPFNNPPTVVANNQFLPPMDNSRPQFTNNLGPTVNITYNQYRQ